jgi:hypothetical protein
VRSFLDIATETLVKKVNKLKKKKKVEEGKLNAIGHGDMT